MGGPRVKHVRTQRGELSRKTSAQLVSRELITELPASRSGPGNIGAALIQAERLGDLSLFVAFDHSFCTEDDSYVAQVLGNYARENGTIPREQNGKIQYVSHPRSPFILLCSFGLPL